MEATLVVKGLMLLSLEGLKKVDMEQRARRS